MILLDDREIVDLLTNRNETGIEETKRKYGRRLFVIAKNILHSNEDAEECVNDTLLKAWEMIPPNRPQMLGVYLMKIIRNLSINRYVAKKAAKRGGGETALLLGELEESVPSLYTTEKAYDAALLTAEINAFLTKANKSARVLFVLRYFHGESISNLSTRLNISESKIKSILFRLRKKLRTHLEKEGVTV